MKKAALREVAVRSLGPFLTAALLLASPARAGDTLWYSIAAENGAAIGYSSEEIALGANGREITDVQEIDLEEPGDPQPMAPWFTVRKQTRMVWRSVLRQDAAGHTVSISATAAIGADVTRSEARIDGGKAVVTRQTSAETRNVTVALPQDVRFDSGDGLLADWHPATTPRLAFDNFNIDAMAVEHVTVEVVPGAVPDTQGRIAVLRKRFDGSSLVAVARLLLDAKGRIVEVTQPMFGANITVSASEQAAALRPHAPYHMLPHMMQKSPYRISRPAMRGHIRYRFAFQGGIEFALPQTGEQRVTAEPGFATVDICDDCGPGLPNDAATLADALRPTAWLQSDAPSIREIAAPVAKLAVSDARKMEILSRKTKPYLGRLDFNGVYSALETLTRHAGDCTEAAALLAALGRAAGIPTRVANGLVYSRESYHGVSNAFMPHSWVLAYVDGKWRSYDAALDIFDSTHIALTVGDGDARSVVAANQLAGLLRWDAMAEVRARPAN